MRAIVEVRRSRFITYALGTLVSCAALGCTQPDATAIVADTTAPGASRLSGTARIIVKFDKGIAYPYSEAYLKGLAEDAGVELAHLRAMAGDNVHVFLLKDLSRTTQLQEVMSRLSARRDVIYVEEDRRLRHQGVK